MFSVFNWLEKHIILTSLTTCCIQIRKNSVYIYLVIKKQIIWNVTIINMVMFFLNIHTRLTYMPCVQYELFKSNYNDKLFVKNLTHKNTYHMKRNLNDDITDEVFDICCELQIHYYKKWLSNLTNPTAIYLRDNELDYKSGNPFGIHTNTNINQKSYISWLIKEKIKYSTSTIVVQVGEFFELVGIDAILAVEFGGLRAMGSKPSMRAGTPLVSLQRLLDSLIQQGLKCLVYEEIKSESPKQGKEIKSRKLMQMVCSASPIYFRGVQSVENHDSRHSSSVLFVLSDSCIVVDINNTTYSSISDVSKQSLLALIATLSPSEILIAEKRFKLNINEYNTTIIPSYINNVDYVKEYVQQVYFINKNCLTYCNPLRYQFLIPKSTSDALGITTNVEHIPSAIESALGVASYLEKKFFLDWLLIRPTEHARRAMELVCKNILDGNITLHKQILLNPSKIMGLISSGGVCKDMRLLHSIYDRMNRSIPNEYIHTVASFFIGLSQLYNDYTDSLSNLRSILKEKLVFNTNPIEDEYIPLDFIIRNNQFHIYNNKNIHVTEAQSNLSKVIKTLKNEYGVSVAYCGSNDNDIVIMAKNEPDIPNVFRVPNNNKITRRNAWTTPDLQEAVKLFLISADESIQEQRHIIMRVCNFIKLSLI